MKKILEKFLKNFKCNFFVCCKSKCSINDTDGDGIPDTLEITKEDGEQIISVSNREISSV